MITFEWFVMALMCCYIRECFCHFQYAMQVASCGTYRYLVDPFSANPTKVFTLCRTGLTHQYWFLTFGHFGSQSSASRCLNVKHHNWWVRPVWRWTLQTVEQLAVKRLILTVFVSVEYFHFLSAINFRNSLHTVRMHLLFCVAGIFSNS